MFRAFISSSGAETISDFTLQTVEDWLSRGRTQLGWSAKTAHLYRCYQKLFADWCVSRGYLRGNFVNEIPKPKLRKQIPASLDEEQCKLLLDWVRSYPFSTKFERSRAVAIISTFIGTGVRLSELYNLRVEDVNIERGELFVREGKGGKDRRIPFRRSLAAVLERYLADRRRLNRCCPWFFTALRSDTKMGDRVVYRLVCELRKRSGIFFTPHKLRHTFATRMLDCGVDVRVVQELLGHSDLATTARYLAASDRRIDDQVRTKGFDV